MFVYSLKIFGSPVPGFYRLVLGIVSWVSGIVSRLSRVVVPQKAEILTILSIFVKFLTVVILAGRLR